MTNNNKTALLIGSGLLAATVTAAIVRPTPIGLSIAVASGVVAPILVAKAIKKQTSKNDPSRKGLGYGDVAQDYR